MSARVLLSLLASTWLATAVADPAPKKYTPEIHGQLRNGGASAPANVCLRQSGSEIRSCGYTGSDGRFFIPSSGPMHSARAKSDGETDGAQPMYWLETGNVLKPQKLWPIEPADRYAAIDLDCDLARADSAAERSDYRACQSKPSKPLVMNIPRDPTPYMMPRHEAPSK
ncbi:MAG TPA: hypothetical protein VHE32_14185 [Rhodanobacteraceae bacterium]|jgi:hypothetical protein|nr:hypothetical protein [Rhodanobacteraceae bacterium]